jgi:hypothetical protein
LAIIPVRMGVGSGLVLVHYIDRERGGARGVEGELPMNGSWAGVGVGRLLVGGRALTGVNHSGRTGVGEERGHIFGKMVLAERRSEGLGEADIAMDVNGGERGKVRVNPEQEWVIGII